MLVHNTLEKSARRLPDKDALVCGPQRWTYQQINRAADLLAEGLTDLGLEKQGRAVIFLENCPESIISIYGILKAGAVFIIINPAMKAAKLNYILKDSGARILITDAARAGVVEKALAGVPELRHIIWCCGPEEKDVSQPGLPCMPGGQSVSWLSLFERGEPDPGRKPPGLKAADLAAIIYTSGSTGRPKGVMSTHANVLASARSITGYLENVADDIILNTLPLSFDYGLYQVLMAFLFGGRVIQEKYFVYPYEILQRLIVERATGFPIVPTMAAILLQMRNLDQFDFSALRYISNTGAALPVRDIRKLREIFPQVQIFSMYGLTECKRVSYLPPADIDRKPDSVGIPMPGVDVFIVDGKDGRVKPGDTGELVVRGPNVMQGYWNAPEDTARSFRPDEQGGGTCLYTGDLFRQDEEGYLYFVARKDDLLKIKGERVSPREIEDCLSARDDVAESAVIGAPCPICGQVVKVFIVPKRDRTLTDEEIIRYCQENLEPFLVPKYVEFRDALPKTGTGKIDKKALI
jgi:amino acid adenylation domain-containing protein